MGNPVIGWCAGCMVCVWFCAIRSMGSLGPDFRAVKMEIDTCVGFYDREVNFVAWAVLRG